MGIGRGPRSLEELTSETTFGWSGAFAREWGPHGSSDGNQVREACSGRVSSGNNAHFCILRVGSEVGLWRQVSSQDPACRLAQEHEFLQLWSHRDTEGLRQVSRTQARVGEQSWSTQHQQSQTPTPRTAVGKQWPCFYEWLHPGEREANAQKPNSLMACSLQIVEGRITRHPLGWGVQVMLGADWSEVR